MTWLDRLLGRYTYKNTAPAFQAVIEKIINEETAHLEAALVTARLRVAKYDGMGRLTHTQEMLRAQAVAQVECYAKMTSPTFRASLAKRIVEEILQ